VKKRISILITSKPIKRQSYSTVGDYTYFPVPNGFSSEIWTTEMENIDHSWLIAIHEVIESYLCFKKGLTDEEITKFDVDNLDLIEPGKSKKAPYHKEHAIATKIEKELARILKVNWKEYDKAMVKELKLYK